MVIIDGCSPLLSLPNSNTLYMMYIRDLATFSRLSLCQGRVVQDKKWLKPVVRRSQSPFSRALEDASEQNAISKYCFTATGAGPRAV